MLLAKSATILLVDDSKTMRHVLRVHLSGSGHEFVEAESGRSALEALERSPVDLIVSDVRMEDIDGLELVRRVRKRETLGQRVPIILISGDRSPALRARAMISGADEFIQKPVDPHALRRLVDDLLAQV
jgi:CheY-like chemotaxis protein